MKDKFDFSKLGFKDKIETLNEIFKFRVVNFDEFQKSVEGMLEPLLKARKDLKDRIDKYKDDGFIKEMLEDNLNLIDKRWETELASATSELNHLKRQRPLMEKIIEKFKLDIFDKETLELFFDLFLWREFENWFEMKNQKNEKGVEKEEQKDEIREN